MGERRYPALQEWRQRCLHESGPLQRKFAGSLLAKITIELGKIGFRDPDSPTTFEQLPRWRLPSPEHWSGARLDTQNSWKLNWSKPGSVLLRRRRPGSEWRWFGVRPDGWHSAPESAFRCGSARPPVRASDCATRHFHDGKGQLRGLPAVHRPARTIGRGFTARCHGDAARTQASMPKTARSARS